MTDFVRVIEAPPHDTGHDGQLPHDDNWQSTAHGVFFAVLQLRDSVKMGHSYPLYRGVCTIERLRDCTPPPQDAVHVVHSSKGDTTQCNGHGPSEHVFVRTFAVSGQGMPPFFM